MVRKCLVGDYKMKQPLQYSQRFGKMCNCDCLDLQVGMAAFPRRRVSKCSVGVLLK